MTDAAKLRSLLNKWIAADSESAEIKGGVGQELKDAKAAGVDLDALRICKRIAKMDEAKQSARLRNIYDYANKLGLGAQLDIEDAIDARTPVEKTMDGEASAGPPENNVLQLLNLKRPRALTEDLKRFHGAILEAETAEAINRGYDRFALDHPELKTEALELTRARLQAL
jgi:uncharacterized protein (UPF0335 family)